VYDVAAGTFVEAASAGSNAATSTYFKFIGAAAVGNHVVFAPCHADAVGVYDVKSRSFDASVSTGSLSSDTFKFAGAAAVGDLVVFTPFKAGVVGVFNVTAGTFDSSVATGHMATTLKLMGAATLGNVEEVARYLDGVVEHSGTPQEAKTEAKS